MRLAAASIHGELANYRKSALTTTMHVQAIAEQLLQQQLQQLPAGTVAISLSLLHSNDANAQSASLLLTRCSYGRPPVLLRLALPHDKDTQVSTQLKVACYA